jgi:putative transposase
MGGITQYRKRVKHYDEPGHFHELTFSCYQRMPVLTNDSWRGMLSEAINRAMDGQGYRLAAFVYMPEHVHLVVHPLVGAQTIDRLIRAIKRPYSYRLKQHLISVRSPLLGRLTVRQRPGVETFRYWQEGPGYDRNLTEAATVLSAIDYIHLNPVRRGLCEAAVQWRWSSAKHYAAEELPDDPLLPIVHGLPPEFVDPGMS